MPDPQKRQPIDPSMLLEDESELDPSQVQRPDMRKPGWQRALEGWWSNVNPMGIARMLTVDNPVTNWGAAVNSGMDLGYSHADLANRAIESAKRVGRGELSAIPETAGLTAAAAWPLQGGAMAHAGDRIASGDYAGGLGETAGLLTPFALSHAGPVVSKTGSALRRGGQRLANVHVGPFGKLPVLGLMEAAYKGDPVHAAIAGSPYLAQGAGWGMEQTGAGLTGLRNAATRISERAQSALGLDPLAERLGFTQQTPINQAALDAAHRARTPAPQPGRTARQQAGNVRPPAAAATTDVIEPYAGQTSGYDPANPTFGEPALPIEPTVFEQFGGPSVEAPTGGAFQGEPALPIQPTPMAETPTGVPLDTPILRKAGEPAPPSTNLGQPQTAVLSDALEGLRRAAETDLEPAPAQTITPASKSNVGYDTGQPAVRIADETDFAMGDNPRPRTYTPPAEPLPQNAWSPEIGYSPEPPPQAVPTPTTPKKFGSFEGVDWQQMQTQPDVPSSVEGLKTVADEGSDNPSFEGYPRTIEGNPYSKLNWEGFEPTTPVPSLSPSLQALSDAANGEGVGPHPLSTADMDFDQFSKDFNDIQEGFLATDEGVRQPQGKAERAAINADAAAQYAQQLMDSLAGRTR